MEIIDSIKEKYLIWRTGKTREEREWEAWVENNINKRATRIRDVFVNFEYIITADSSKFFDPREPFAWVPCQEARQYLWPVRPLGENAVWIFERVINCPATAWQWEINELCGEDHVFVATNNRHDAVMIALKYGE